MGAEVSKVVLSEEEERACARNGRENILKAFSERALKDKAALMSVAPPLIERSSASVGTQTAAKTHRPGTVANDPRCDSNNKRKASDVDIDVRVRKASKASSDVAAKDHGPTNLVLTCCEKAWNVHREVILPASPALFAAYMQASDQSMLRMRDCKPALVHAMLDFLYNEQYNAEKYCETGESYPIHFHALMYLLATTYEIGPLAYTSFTRFSSILVQDPNPRGLRLAIQEICQTSSDRKKPLRMVLLASLQKLRPVENGISADSRPHPLLEHARKLISDSAIKSSALPINLKSSNDAAMPPVAPKALSAGRSAQVTPQASPVGHHAWKTRPRTPAAGLNRPSPAQNPPSATRQSTSGLTEDWPEGEIEYLHCNRVFKKGGIKGLPGLFACPNCGVAKSAMHWDSIRKPWNWSGC